MKEVLSENIRNVSVVGHGQTGKTSLVSAILFNTKMVNRLTRVDQGNTITDYDEEEIARKISIQLATAYAFSDKIKLNLLDVPGFTNFIWEAHSAAQVSETGLIVVCAQEGAQVQTEKMFELFSERKKAVIFLINKMGKELADYEKSFGSLQEIFGRNVAPVYYPMGSGAGFSGVIDILKQRAYHYQNDEKGDFKETDIPAEYSEKIAKLREELVEKIAENSEKLMEKFLEGNELTLEELSAGLKQAVAEGTIYPCLVADALMNKGVQQVVDFLVQYAPDPLQKKELDLAEGKIKIDKNGSFVGQVFKTISDPFSGKISLIRVFNGVFRPDSSYFNSNKEIEERVGAINLMQGKNLDSYGEAKLGDIVAVTKLKETLTGDTLCQKGEKIRMPEIKFPQPSITFAAEPKNRGDEGKISNALQRINEEDPTLKIQRDPQTKELLLAGNGQLHIELVVSKLKKRYGVEVVMKPPKIPYRETILGKADVEKKYKKQSGGRGQYAHVLIRMEPLPRGADYEFVCSLVGMSIPRNYVPAIEKGIIEAKQSGVLAGYPVVDIKVDLYDGTYHEVDSSDLAFKIAGSMAFKMAMKQAKPTILEPIMKIEVAIPEENMGEINGVISGKRGRIQGMEAKGKNHIVKALVPMAEMLDFEPVLTSITAGRGTYFMELSHYEEVPAHLQKKIIDEAVKEGRVQKEEE